MTKSIIICTALLFSGMTNFSRAESADSNGDTTHSWQMKKINEWTQNRNGKSQAQDNSVEYQDEYKKGTDYDLPTAQANPQSRPKDGNISKFGNPTLVQVVGTAWYDTTFFGSFLGAFLGFLFGLILLGIQSWVQSKRDERDRLIELRHFYEATDPDRTLFLQVIDATKMRLQASGEPKIYPIKYAESINEKRKERSKAFIKEWRNLEIAIGVLKINADNFNESVGVYNDQITLSRNTPVWAAINQSRQGMSIYLDIMKEQLIKINAAMPKEKNPFDSSNIPIEG
jgi:hypothetical protein